MLFIFLYTVFHIIPIITFDHRYIRHSRPILHLLNHHRPTLLALPAPRSICISPNTNSSPSWAPAASLSCIFPQPSTSSSAQSASSTWHAEPRNSDGGCSHWRIRCCLMRLGRPPGRIVRLSFRSAARARLCWSFAADSIFTADSSFVAID